MEVKNNYKSTEAGFIPQDWECVSLQDVSKFENGKAHENEIEANGKYIVVNSKFVSTEGKVKKYSNKGILIASVNDLLIVMSDVPNGRAIAKCFYVNENNKYTVNQRIGKIAPNTVNSKLLYYIVNRNPYYLSFDDGVKQTNIRKQDVIGLKIAIPSCTKEQQAIATALSDIDNLINSLTKLINKKKSIKQGAMQELLTGKKRLEGFSGELEKVRLGDILEMGHGKSQHNIVNQNGKYPILATGGEIGRTNDFLYDKPSVLIGRKGTIDKPQYMNTPFWTIDTLFYTKIQESVNPKYMYYKFCMIDWHLYNEASGVPSLSARTIESIEIMKPSLHEQEAIADIISIMDDEIELFEAKLNKYKFIKQGMMKELLTGRIRLLEEVLQ